MPKLRVVALLLGVVVACTPQSRTTDTVAAAESDQARENPNAFWANVGVVFDPDSVSAGDSIGTLVVDRVAVHPAYDSSTVGSVGFRGELELTGKMIPHFDADVKATCFEADSLSAARMPRWKGDSRRPWFCFRGLGAYAPKPGVPDTGTIVIDRFTIHFTMSDAVNEAQLLSGRALSPRRSERSERVSGSTIPAPRLAPVLGK